MQSRIEKWDGCARLLVRPKNKGEWHILFHNLLRLQIISGWRKVGVNDRLHGSNLILVMLEILQIQIFFFFFYLPDDSISEMSWSWFEENLRLSRHYSLCSALLDFFWNKLPWEKQKPLNCLWSQLMFNIYWNWTFLHSQ